MMEELGIAMNEIDQKCYEEEENVYDHELEEVTGYFDHEDDDESIAYGDNDDHDDPSLKNSSISGSSHLTTRYAPSLFRDNLDEIRMYLTDDEIIYELGIAGGREELTNILINGALAKNKMIK